MSFAVVTGSSGMIGRRLAARLRADGFWVRGVDLHPPHGRPEVDEFAEADLRHLSQCEDALDPGIAEDDLQIWHLSANHGGVGYTEQNPAPILADNVRMDANVVTTATQFGYHRLLYTSSVAVYPPRATGELTVEADAYPADPPTEYGWSKLTGERIVSAANGVNDLVTRIARLENCYGPGGEREPGRAGVLPSLCLRAAAATGDTLDVWGDPSVERAFTWVNDAVEALCTVMSSEHAGPINVGTGDYVTIRHLADVVCRISGKDLTPRPIPGPDGGKRDRLDTTLIQNLGWAPSVTLEEGVARLYRWAVTAASADPTPADVEVAR